MLPPPLLLVVTGLPAELPDEALDELPDEWLPEPLVRVATGAEECDAEPDDAGALEPDEA